MQSRKILLGILVVIAIVGAWQISKKKDMLQMDRITEAWSEFRGEETAPVVASANPAPAAQSAAAEEEYSGPPVADPAPEIPEADAGLMFPFAADTPPLTSTVAFPEKKAPIVYVATCGDSNNTFTSASICFGEFYKYQVTQQGSAGLLMNALPNSWLLKYASRAFSNREKQVPYETYLQDAEIHSVDLLLYPTFDGTSSAPLVNVKMVDLNTSRTENWSSQQAGLTSPNQIIIAAAQAALKFAGYDDDVIAKTNIQKGAPSDASFAWYASASVDDRNYENLVKLADADPEFVYPYSEDAGTTWIGQLIDRGVHKFPDDPRLLMRKATALADADSTVALVRYMSELIRRYPDNLFAYFNHADRLAKVFPQDRNAKETPPEYKALLDQLGLMSERHSDSYALAWNYAYGLRNLAEYKRGTHTVDKIPDHIWPEREKYNLKAYHIMTGLAEKYPDFATLINQMAWFSEDVAAADPHEQRRLNERVIALDPRATSAEIRNAFTHSIGWGDPKDFLSAMDKAFKRHAGDPHATAELSKAMKEELYRQVGWKQMTMEEAHTNGNPYLNRFLDSAAFVYSAGMNLGMDSDRAYYTAMEMQGNRDKINEWRKTGQNSYVAALVAEEAYKASDWETCAKFCRLVMPHMQNDDKGHYIRYYLLKSLWKLKRYEESLQEARKGIFAFPGKQTFPYMYAVVASEAGINLESAYDCAWYAVSLDTTNKGANDTFEKLRAQLNKPPHPALEALGN